MLIYTTLLNLENLILNSNPFKSEEEFERKKNNFSRYPITPLESCTLDKMRPVVILRNPKDQIISYYTNHAYKIDGEEINSGLFEKALKNYLKYFDFWKKYFENRISNKDYLLIKHEELVSFSEQKLKEMLIFYNYDVKDELISKAASINSTENTLKFIGNINIQRIRFTDPNKKEIYKAKLLNWMKFIKIMT